MNAREYFPTGEDVGSENKDSVRLDEYAIVPRGLTTGREPAPTENGLSRPLAAMQGP